MYYIGIGRVKNLLLFEKNHLRFLKGIKERKYYVDLDCKSI